MLFIYSVYYLINWDLDFYIHLFIVFLILLILFSSFFLLFFHHPCNFYTLFETKFIYTLSRVCEIEKILSSFQKSISYWFEELNKNFNGQRFFKSLKLYIFYKCCNFFPTFFCIFFFFFFCFWKRRNGKNLLPMK